MSTVPPRSASAEPSVPDFWRGRLFRKYFLPVMALVCGALLASGSLGLYFSYQENKSALASLQKEKAIAAAARIEQFTRQIEQQLAFVALSQLGSPGVEQSRIEFLKLLRVVPAVTDVSRLDAAGREQLTVSRLALDVSGTSRDRAQDPAFRGAQPGRTWFGPVYFRKETEPYMTVAVRSLGESGGVTIAEVNLKFIWDVVSRIKIGRKGKAYVVDGTAHLIADPDIGLVLRKTDLSGLIQVQTAFSPLQQAEPAMLARDGQGRQVLTAYAPIDPLGWKVFVEQPVAEVYATLNASILRMVVLLVIGLLVSAFASLLLARGMVRPIRMLAEGARHIGVGELDQRIEVHTGDELEALAEQFNRMTERLRESYAGLERKVEERTKELQDTLEQQTAISEILRVISSSPTDVTPVLQAVAERAARLCDSKDARLFLIEGNQLKLVAGFGEIPVYAIGTLLLEINRGSVGGRSVFDSKPVHVTDLQSASTDDYPQGREIAMRFGHRTTLGVPLMREGKALGTIVLRRIEVQPFTERQIALVQTFADQAAIAIENVRLFNETKESLEQQTAISDILRVISSSPTDVKPVLQAVAERAARLCDSQNAVILLVEGDKLVFSQVSVGNLPRSSSGTVLPIDRQSVNGRAVVDGRAVHVSDIASSEEYPLGRELAIRFGHRTILAVPLMREGQALGTINLRRTEVRPFTERQIALVQTFADQAAIAIENVRLFNETKEALERQTATNEILGVISNSPTDMQPVLDAVAERATRLCESDVSGVWLLQGGRLRLHAGFGERSARLDIGHELALDRRSILGRSVSESTQIQIEDIATLSGEEYATARQLQQDLGYRTLLVVPLLREGVALGAIALRRAAAHAFTEHQIALVQTFANQAAIAIENVRLFHEIQSKSRELEIANKHKSEFLANMSHELRTPLNAIIGFSEVLLERMFGELNEKQADYLNDIFTSGKHLLSLINDILDLAKIEAGRTEHDVATDNETGALENAHTQVPERAQRHTIPLSLTVDPEVGAIQGDERKFKQIVLNLLSNAVKFTRDGGRVDVRVRLDADRIEVSVKDTGIGIAAKDQQAVFEEFRQVGGVYSNKAEGTGLGLTLTRKFVEMHGGQLRLDSELGVGSTFAFTLPVRQ